MKRVSSTAEKLFHGLPFLFVFGYIALLLVFFGRGIDVTDEGFYLENFRHWQSLTALPTFFGAYFAGPFAWLGEDIRAMRVFGLLLLMGAAWFFAIQFLRGLSLGTSITRSGAAVAACAVVSYYCPYGTLYTPSYNLLTLVLMLIGTGLVLRACGRANGTIASGRDIPYMVAYGLCMGMLLFTKTTSFVLTFIAHLAIVLAAARHRPWRLVGALSGAALVGACANFAYLSAKTASVFVIVQDGLQYMQLFGTRGVQSEARRLLVSLVKAVLGAPWIALFICTVASLMTSWKRARKWQPEAVALLMLAGIAPWLFLSFHFTARVGTIWMSTLMLGLIYWLHRERTRGESPRPETRDVAVMGIIALLPLVYAFGTASDLAHTSAMAVVFPLIVCVALLTRICAVSRRRPWMVGLCLAAIALLPLRSLLAPWHHAEYSYRLLSSLEDSNVALRAGGSVLWTDAKTAAAVNEFRTILDGLGFEPGTPMLDMTGAAPGLIFLANGRPLGRAWIPGGYPDSHEGTRFLLAKVNATDLRSAWVLASPDHPRRLEWTRLIAERLGSVPFVSAAKFQLPLPRTASNQARSATIEIWTPTSSPAPSSQARD